MRFFDKTVAEDDADFPANIHTHICSLYHDPQPILVIEPLYVLKSPIAL